MKISISKTMVVFLMMSIMIMFIMISFLFLAELMIRMMENPVFAICTMIGALLMPLIEFAVIDRGVDYE